MEKDPEQRMDAIPGNLLPLSISVPYCTSIVPPFWWIFNDFRPQKQQQQNYFLSFFLTFFVFTTIVVANKDLEVA